MPKRTPHTDLTIITGDQAVQRYLEMQKKTARFYLKGVLRILKDQKKNGRFLEIGPGPGYQTVEISKRFPGAGITALEPSSDMIDVATAYAQSQGVLNRITFIKGAVEDDGLIRGLGRFDLIYSTFSLHHWKEPAKAIQNLNGALQKGGVLLIYDFERHWLTYYLPLRKGISESLRASYTVKEIISILSVIKIKHYQVQRNFPYISILIKNGGDHAEGTNS